MKQDNNLSSSYGNVKLTDSELFELLQPDFRKMIQKKKVKAVNQDE